MAQTTIAEWEAKAACEFPELAVADSPFNRLFLEKAALLREKSPQTLADPSWPYRLAVRIAGHPELLRSGSESTPNAGDGVLGGVLEERSRELSEMCQKVVLSKLESGELEGSREDWIIGGEIPRSHRVQALQLAGQTLPAAVDVLAKFLQTALATPGRNSEASSRWLEAFLWTDSAHTPLHDKVATRMAVAPERLDLRILQEFEGVKILMDWIACVPNGFNKGISATVQTRANLLAEIIRNEFHFGKLLIDREFCFQQSLLLAFHNRGIGYIAIEEATPEQWPDSFLLNTRAPMLTFQAEHKDWAVYLLRLGKMSTNFLEDRFPTPLPANNELLQPGGFEGFLLWKISRMSSAREGVVWLDVVSKVLTAQANPVARDTRRIFAALIHHLAPNVEKEATR